MSIVVATALGPFDHDAREAAALLAKHMHEKVVLVHVLEHSEPPAVVVRSMLEQAAQEMSRFGTAVETLILHGDPLTALTTYARSIQPRLVVIGGAAPKDSAAAGERRKVRHLVKTLDVPVLCIPHAGPLMQTLMSGRRMRVLVRSEHDAAIDEALLQQARGLRNVVPCQISVLCASEADTTMDFSLRVATTSHADILLVNARLLEAPTSWTFGADTPPMLFVPSHAQRHQMSEKSEAAAARKKPQPVAQG